MINGKTEIKMKATNSKIGPDGTWEIGEIGYIDGYIDSNIGHTRTARAIIILNARAVVADFWDFDIIPDKQKK